MQHNMRIPIEALAPTHTPDREEVNLIEGDDAGSAGNHEPRLRGIDRIRRRRPIDGIQDVQKRMARRRWLFQRRRLRVPVVGVLFGPNEYAMTVTGGLVRVMSGCGGGGAAREMPGAEIPIRIPVPLTIEPLLTRSPAVNTAQRDGCVVRETYRVVHARH